MNKPTFEKVDETTIKMIKEVEVKQEETTYQLDFLHQQELDILKQMNDFVDARNVELEEVRELIAQCKSLDIKSSLEIETASLEEKEILISK